MNSDTADLQPQDPCPRCHAPHLRPFHELTDEQHELVRRLPASADYSLEERAARHLWCTRCWHEETTGGQGNA
ncbi:MAG TPA: hypothetical protein VGB73_19550 [Pyrinomonadaceae bacterium]